MVIKINNLEEANNFLKDKLEIKFQNEIFYNITKFKHFIKEINNGYKIKAPNNAKEVKFYTDFGTIYCNTCIIGEQNIYFFDNDKLILMKNREKTDDIEFSYLDNGYNSSNPLVYDTEQDVQIENYKW